MLLSNSADLKLTCLAKLRSLLEVACGALGKRAQYPAGLQADSQLEYHGYRVQCCPAALSPESDCIHQLASIGWAKFEKMAEDGDQLGLGDVRKSSVRHYPAFPVREELEDDVPEVFNIEGLVFVILLHVQGRSRIGGGDGA
ncbi:hypothetical protein DSO57_1006014 [Entomophthora muscae]|uniref:Uncharacterized protein n=1 Tax=Entomophthora muscae TaxID=34485 RepID=A0ACC2SKX9_9FUNG|nr:hypothetical protein DSO57_1006014 [Entomophthora muscae]